MIYLFRHPEQGEQFAIGADPAEGGDDTTFIALSKSKADVVMASLSKEESSQLGYTLNHVSQWFFKRTGNHPCIAVERNAGLATLAILKELNTPNLFKMPDDFSKTDTEQSERYGWTTTLSSRPKMLDDLALAIRQKALIIPDERTVNQMFTFVRNKNTGRPEHDTGCHDDLIFSLAICLQVIQIGWESDGSWQTRAQEVMKQLPEEDWIISKNISGKPTGFY